MPFTKTTTNLAATITQTTLTDFIKARFAAIGGHTLVTDTTISTNRLLVYEVVFDAAKTYGKVYLWIQVTPTLVVTQQLFATWNTGTNTGTFGSAASINITFTTNVSIEGLTYIKGTEYRFLMLNQGTTACLLGILRPENRHITWVEDSYPFAFMHFNNFGAANMFKDWYTCTLNPYSNDARFYTNLAEPKMSTQNPVNNKRDILAGLIIYPFAGQGIVAKTSDELVSVAGSGLSRGDIIKVQVSGQPDEEYELIYPNYGALALRSV